MGVEVRGIEPPVRLVLETADYSIHPQIQKGIKTGLVA